jgi:hypothetical protein
MDIQKIHILRGRKHHTNIDKYCENFNLITEKFKLDLTKIINLLTLNIILDMTG